MRERSRLTMAALLVTSFVGVLVATGSIHAAQPAPPTSDGAVAMGASPAVSEAAVMRSHSGATGERWLKQSTSKGRPLSLAATLAVALGVLSLLPRLCGRHPLPSFSALSLRRYSVALRAPPSAQLA